MLRHLVEDSTVGFVTDNLNVHNTYIKESQSGVNSVNSDLWEEMFNLISNRNLIAATRWMPSHLEEGVKVRPDSVSDHDIECNEYADKLVEEAAQRASETIPKPIATNIIYYANLVGRIQKRLANIIMQLPAREQNDKVSPSVSVPKIAISEPVAKSKHSLFVI